jgi:nucleotide-binding universal stress UspA family protein
MASNVVLRQAALVGTERPLVSDTIVCGVDDSDQAQDAARVAAQFCAELGLRLALVHVAPPPVRPGVAPHPGEHDYEDSVEAGETLLDQIATPLDIGERVTRHVVVGEASERLRQIAVDEGAQLLVVGSRGCGPLKSVLGSVSSALARDAPCPVLVVPPDSASTGLGQ